MFNYYDGEIVMRERQEMAERAARQAYLLEQADLQLRFPWRERLAVGLIGLAGWLAPTSVPAPVSEARLAYLRQH